MNKNFRINRSEHFKLEGSSVFILVGVTEDDKFAIGIEGDNFDVKRIYTKNKESAKEGFEVLFDKLSDLAEAYNEVEDLYFF